MTNKLSQDHLELFFGSIRAKGGFNNNPTARQFQAAYKRLLVHTQITGPETGNVGIRDNLTILSCGSGQKLTQNENGHNLLQDPSSIVFEKNLINSIDKNQLSAGAWNLTLYTGDVVAYIAGFVVKILRNCVTCSKCLTFLESETVNSMLQQRKQYGKLVRASEQVIEICRVAEKYFRFYCKTEGIFKKTNNLIVVLIKNAFELLPSTILDKFNDHLFDDDPVESHAFWLIKLVLRKYFTIRIHHETAKKMDVIKKYRVRSILTKTILFKHQ